MSLPVKIHYVAIRDDGHQEYADYETLAGNYGYCSDRANWKDNDMRNRGGGCAGWVKANPVVRITRIQVVELGPDDGTGKEIEDA